MTTGISQNGAKRTVTLSNLRGWVYSLKKACKCYYKDKQDCFTGKRCTQETSCFSLLFLPYFFVSFLFLSPLSFSPLSPSSSVSLLLFMSQMLIIQWPWVHLFEFEALTFIRILIPALITLCPKTWRQRASVWLLLPVSLVSVSSFPKAQCLAPWASWVFSNLVGRGWTPWEE